MIKKPKEDPRLQYFYLTHQNSTALPRVTLLYDSTTLNPFKSDSSSSSSGRRCLADASGNDPNAPSGGSLTAAMVDEAEEFSRNMIKMDELVQAMGDRAKGIVPAGTAGKTNSNQQ